MQRKIRVLQLTANLGMGGLERVVINLCKNINVDMYDVSVCCLKYKGKLARELEDIGMPVHLLPQVTKRPDYTAFWRLKKILLQEKPDLVHTHNANAFIDGAMASCLAGVPALINTDHARKFPGRWTERMMEAVCARKADKFVAVSEETKKNLMRYERIPAAKIEVIRNGIDGKDYDIEIDVQKKKEELGLLGFDHVVGLGVRLTPQKGIAHLIEAAPLVLAMFPKTAFLVAGKGYLRESLMELAIQRGVSSHFHFIGPRLDLPEILQTLDVYVLPSEWEGLPLALLESMAASRAIVATRVGGNPYVIEHGRTGLLVESKDVKGLAEAVCRLLSNYEERGRLGINAQKRFYQGFSVQHMTGKYEELYSEILKTKNIMKWPQ